MCYKKSDVRSSSYFCVFKDCIQICKASRCDLFYGSYARSVEHQKVFDNWIQIKLDINAWQWSSNFSNSNFAEISEFAYDSYHAAGNRLLCELPTLGGGKNVLISPPPSDFSPSIIKNGIWTWNFEVVNQSAFPGQKFYITSVNPHQHSTGDI